MGTTESARTDETIFLRITEFNEDSTGERLQRNGPEYADHLLLRCVGADNTKGMTFARGTRDRFIGEVFIGWGRIESCYQMQEDLELNDKTLGRILITNADLRTLLKFRGNILRAERQAAEGALRR